LLFHFLELKNILTVQIIQQILESGIIRYYLLFNMALVIRPLIAEFSAQHSEIPTQMVLIYLYRMHIVL
jgi:hypothetical protein